ncbi:MAG: hypothetical protein LBF04_06255 [Prevotellaceae bacterium]|jgi:hypothetical protein|nr:hypothetical protein [Prevotellaceae bacterium]
MEKTVNKITNKFRTEAKNVEPNGERLRRSLEDLLCRFRKKIVEKNRIQLTIKKLKWI